MACLLPEEVLETSKEDENVLSHDVYMWSLGFSRGIRMTMGL